MRIDLHCHTKATKTGDSPKRNIESDKFKEKVNGVGVEIIGITNHNEFDYEQYLKFIEEVDNDFMILDLCQVLGHIFLHNLNH